MQNATLSFASRLSHSPTPPAARMTLPVDEQQRTHFQRVMNERTLSDHSSLHRGETARAKHSTSRLSECDLRSLWLHKPPGQTEKTSFTLTALSTVDVLPKFLHISFLTDQLTFIFFHSIIQKYHWPQAESVAPGDWFDVPLMNSGRARGVTTPRAPRGRTRGHVQSRVRCRPLSRGVSAARTLINNCSSCGSWEPKYKTSQHVASCINHRCRDLALVTSWVFVVGCEVTS